jgi:hypothetical protein
MIILFADGHNNQMPIRRAAAGAANGSQRIQTALDSSRPVGIVRPGERLSVRLRQTVPDFSKLHGMQKVRDSNPLSSTDFPDLCSDGKDQAKNLSVLGFLVALA